MRKDNIKEFFRQYDQRTQTIVEAVLAMEQEYISYELRTNNRQLQEIKQHIKQFIDRMDVQDK